MTEGVNVMARAARTPLSRGAVSGALLILLGAWGGLVPFVGPYFHYAYTPDRAWAYTSGRLWLSIAPGAVAVLAGLVLVSTRWRALGWLAALLAAVAGAWFIIGTTVTGLAISSGSVSPGTPLPGALGSLSSATRQFLEQLGFFTGTGMLIIFLAAVALGRFSVVGVKDAALAEAEEAELAAEQAAEAAYAGGQQPFGETQDQLQTVSGQYPTAQQFPESQEGTATGEQYEASPRLFTPAPPSDQGQD